MRDRTQKVRPAAMGMLFGMWIGGGVGVLAFVLTGNPVWFTVAGLGVAFGLSLGAAVERRRGSMDPRRDID